MTTNQDITAVLERGDLEWLRGVLGNQRTHIHYSASATHEEQYARIDRILAALSRPQPTPPADIAGVLERAEVRLDYADRHHPGSNLVLLLRDDLRALTQHVRAHLSGGGVEEDAPSHTDLMVSPEALDAYLAKNPPAISVLDIAADALRPFAEEADAWNSADDAFEFSSVRFGPKHLRAARHAMAEILSALSASNREEPKGSGVEEGVREKVTRIIGAVAANGSLSGWAQTELLALLSDQTPKGEESGKRPELCDDPDAAMCSSCDCWKLTREMCS